MMSNCYKDLKKGVLPPSCWLPQSSLLYCPKNCKIICILKPKHWLLPTEKELGSVIFRKMTRSSLYKYLVFFCALYCFVSAYFLCFRNPFQASHQSFLAYNFCLCYTLCGHGNPRTAFGKQCDFPIKSVFTGTDLVMACRGFDFFL